MTLDDLAQIIAARASADPDTSWTAKLLAKGPEKCAEKFGEEAIEAIIEALEPKRALVRALDAVLDPSAVIATNTSSLPITEIAAVTGRPESVIGMHFMNPVPVMALVEMIRGIATEEETFSCATDSLYQRQSWKNRGDPP